MLFLVLNFILILCKWSHSQISNSPLSRSHRLKGQRLLFYLAATCCLQNTLQSTENCFGYHVGSVERIFSIQLIASREEQAFIMVLKSSQGELCVLESQTDHQLSTDPFLVKEFIAIFHPINIQRTEVPLLQNEVMRSCREGALIKSCFFLDPWWKVWLACKGRSIFGHLTGHVFLHCLLLFAQGLS